ncbi:MAG: NAD(P)(+) transhydrogenase (Re/Si-specific) subunit alpha, partial [Candidatus Marinimicrobia bacterium]|nr:NAD(P)(+) transhydrogenase (Re/Si-specific) subunit alpha [Candidatus Neomarinimicrobiota bacterium]
IVDLAAEGGGNCELTQPGETLNVNGVHILGPLNLPSTIPHHASQMYSKNVTSFLENLLHEGELNLNLEDPIIKDTLLTHKGEVVNPIVRELLGLPASSQPVSNERSDS